MATKKTAPDPATLQQEIARFMSGKAADIAAAIDTLQEEEAEIQRKADERKAMIREQIETLSELHRQATGKPYLPGPRGRGRQSSGSNGTRVRRGQSELEADAKRILDFVKKNPGSKAGDIRDGNPGLKMPQDISGFVAKYAGAKLKTEGERAGTTYTAG